MDFLVKLGENGYSFAYPNISSSERVSVLQEKIKNDTKIEIKDQILFTKKGYRLKSDELFSSIERDNNFQSTTIRIENSSRNSFVIYLFDERNFAKEANDTSRQQLKENLSAYFLEKDEDAKTLVDANIIDQDYSTNFEYQIGDTSLLEGLGKINPDIIQIENKMFTHYNNIKKKFLSFRNKIKRIKRHIGECDNQIQSFDVILKYTSQFYQNTKAKKSDLVKKWKENQEKNTNITRKFDESLENLKKIELHESLKTEKNKVLLDIYYKPESMLEWKNNCLGSERKLKAKIDQYVSTIKGIKKKIKEERNLIIPSAINAYHSQHSTSDNLIQDAENTFQSIFIRVYEEYKTLRNLLDFVVGNMTDTIVQDNLKDNRWAEGKLKTLEENMKGVTEISDKIDKLLDQIIKMKNHFEQQIISMYKVMLRFISELYYLGHDAYKKYNDEVDKVDKDFSYLNGPALLPGAYQAALLEISRRREYCQTFDRKYKKLQSFIEGEIANRKKFLSQYGKILPSDFIPALKYNPSSIALSGPNSDPDLPKIDIPNDANKNDENKRKGKSEKHAIEEIERLGHEHRLEIQKLKEELQKYKDDHEPKSYKKKMEDLLREYEAEKDKNRVLRSRVLELENKQSGQQFRHESKENKKTGLKDLDIEKLRSEFEQISKIAGNYLKANEQENTSPDLKKNGRDPINVQKLQARINYLTGIIQLTSKANFDVFFKKLSDKQARYDESVLKYENHLMKSEEDVQKEKAKVLLYEEKLQTLTKQNEKLAIQITELKNDVKNKIELLKTKDELIKSITDGRNKLAKEAMELKDQLTNFEKKIKMEHMDVLNNIHNVHNTEIEKYKLKIKTLENDLESKNHEIQLTNKSHINIEKDIKAKEEQINKLNHNIDNLNKRVQKASDDINFYKTKIETLELNLQNKTNEINSLNKQIGNLTTEKTVLLDDLSTYKQFNSEGTKKLQSVNELYKKAEAEKTTLKTNIEKYINEIDKKNIEIENYKKQIEQINSEKKMLKEELPKLAEDQEAAQSKISNLTEELRNKIIELTTLKSNHDLLIADLENVKIKNIRLIEEINNLKAENEKITDENEKLAHQIEADKKTLQLINQKNKDIEIINEQLHIEAQIKINLFNELENKIKVLDDQILNQEESIHQLTDENKTLKETNYLKDSESADKTKELSIQIEKLMNEIKSREIEIENLNSKIHEMNFESERLKDELNTTEILLKEKEQIINKLNSSNEEKYDNANKLSDEIREKEKSISKLTENLKEKNENIQQLITDIKAKDEQIKVLRIEIKVKEEANTKITTENKGKDDTIKKSTTEITNMQAIIKRLENQESTYKEEIKLAKQESSQYRELLDNLRKSNDKLIIEISELKTQLKASQEILAKVNEKHALDLSCQVNFLRIEKGLKILFIPYSEGIYVPFILHQYTTEEYKSINKNDELCKYALDWIHKKEKSIKNNFFLDLEALDDNSQKILKNFSLLVVGTVKDIKKKPFIGVTDANKDAFMVQLEKLDHMMGFEDDDMILKNYAQ